MSIETLQPSSELAQSIKLWTPNIIGAFTFFLGFPSGITLASINWFKLKMKSKAFVNILMGIVGVVIIYLIPEDFTRSTALLINLSFVAYIRYQMKADIAKTTEVEVQYAHWFNGFLTSFIGWGIAIAVAVTIFFLQSLIPSTASYYFAKGSSYFDKGDYKNSVANYNKAIELDPNDFVSYNNRGLSYIGLGDYDQGISDCNKAIELNPNYANAYINRGIGYGFKGDYDQAISDFNKAIALDPNDSYSFYNRALTYNNLGNYEYALADYDKAIELNPKYIEAYVNRGLLHESLGHISDATKDFEKILEISTDPDLQQQVENELMKLQEQ